MSMSLLWRTISYPNVFSINNNIMRMTHSNCSICFVYLISLLISFFCFVDCTFFLVRSVSQFLNNPAHIAIEFIVFILFYCNFLLTIWFKFEELFGKFIEISQPISIPLLSMLFTLFSLVN